MMGKYKGKHYYKEVCRDVKEYAKSDKKSLRQLLLSVVSLVVASSVMVNISYSWFSMKTSTLEAQTYKLDCSKGLRVNDSGTSRMQFKQVTGYLTPASSVDGRNLYFPTDGSDFSNITEQMTFRSSNVGDKNKNYIQIDFTLTAQQNHTALYINDAKTSIKLKDQNEQDSDYTTNKAACLRAALWSSTAQNGVPNTPIVFNSTANTVRTAAIEDVDRATGAFISFGRQTARPFSDFAFGGEPVATLSKGVETKFSYIIWLEGTDPKCTDKILSKDIQINLAFTTSWDKTQNIRFEDHTPNHWVTEKVNPTVPGAEKTYNLYLRYNEVDSQGNSTGNVTEFNMYKYNEQSNSVWSCNIPGDMHKNISFILRPLTPGDPIYEFTYDSKHSGQRSYNRGSNRLYVGESAIDSPHTSGDNSTHAGYWVAIGDSDGAGHDSGDLDGDEF